MLWCLRQALSGFDDISYLAIMPLRSCRPTLGKGFLLRQIKSSNDIHTHILPVLDKMMRIDPHKYARIQKADI